MTQLVQNPVILALQCTFLFVVITFAVLFGIALIKDIDDGLPSIIPRRLKLPVWFAAVLLFWYFSPDIFPPVLDFIHSKLNVLTKLAADTFAAEPFLACSVSLCFGFLIGSFCFVASSFKTVIIMTERHRKDMFEELDKLIARCPCRPEGGVSDNAASFSSEYQPGTV